LNDLVSAGAVSSDANAVAAAVASGIIMHEPLLVWFIFFSFPKPLVIQTSGFIVLFNC